MASWIMVMLYFLNSLLLIQALYHHFEPAILGSCSKKDPDFA